MSDSPQYIAFREFARATIALEVMKATQPLQDEVRSLRGQLESRGTPQVIEGPAGKDGADGKDGRDGRDGKDGDPGERGADGIATMEQIEEIAQRAVAELHVRTFADLYQGVYQPGQEYARSQMTTWGGSLFLAQVDTRSKPGESPDWKMIVKRGADAKR